MPIARMPDRDDQVSVRRFGARPGASAAQNTAGLNAAFAYGSARKIPVYIPGGVYDFDPPVTWPGPVPMISGAGFNTWLVATNTLSSGLICGLGTGQASPAGWVRDFHIRAPEVYSPAGRTAALLLYGVRWTEIRNIGLHFFPIGLDMQGTDFGCSFYNVTTTAHECKYGAVFRADGGFGGAGNDIPLYNCRFWGGDVGFWMEGRQGSYHFHGCILGGGTKAGNTPQDNRGSCLTTGLDFNAFIDSGADWATSTLTPLGSCGITGVGLTFESAHNGWVIRHHGAGTDPGGLHMNLMGGACFGQAGAIGVMKVSGGYNEIITFRGFGVNGAFSNAVPIVYQGAGGASRPHLLEEGTVGKLCTFAGVQRNMHESGMLVRSSVGVGHWIGSNKWMHYGLVFSRSGNDVTVSTDFATTFLSKFVQAPHS